MGKLPRGIRLDHSYVQVRLMHEGKVYHKNFGPDCPLARELAAIHLAKKREEILMGKFGIAPQLPERTFAELVPFYKKMWAAEKDGDGSLKHSETSQMICFTMIDRLLTPFFGKMKFHLIRSVDVEKWRAWRLSSGVLGTTVNREQVPLSSMFTHMAKAVALEMIPKFKLPEKNPCQHVEKADMRKRERIPTDYELKKLKLAFINLGDTDGWEICKLALKSVLSEKDLRKLELGTVIDTERSKTGVPIHLPITVLQALNWSKWRRRWERARKEACLPDLQFRDLRKTGGNWLLDAGFDLESVSQYFGHASTKTTETSYKVRRAMDKMKPMSQNLEDRVEGI